MKRTKKILLVLITLFSFSAASYAVEVSFGASMQWGIGNSVLRGNDFNDYESHLKSLDFNGLFDISFVPSINIMLEFSPFFAIETGLYYNNSTLRYDIISIGRTPIWGFPYPDIDGTVVFGESTLEIPIMLRLQYEWTRVLLYGSVGPKFIIPVADYVWQNWIEDGLGTLPDIESRDFYMDVAFALGIEFRAGKANYIGIRVSYDLNVISPIKSIGGEKVKSFYNDTWFSGITYRYAFNSKWKKEAVAN